MDREIKVFVHELCTADLSYSVFKRKGSDTWETMVIDTAFDTESTLEAYEAAPVVKLIKASEAPEQILSIMRDISRNKEKFDKAVASGREMAYVEDADGDTSYNFVMFYIGEIYKMMQDFGD